MNNEALERLLAQQRSYFASGKTRSIHWRVEQLKKLKQAIIKYEPDILDALHADIGKPPMQAYGSEIFLCLHEINNALKKIHCWTRAQRVSTPWYMLPARSEIVYEPYGVALIISPWNYPVQLTFLPLIGAIAAGNCAIIKPSEFSPVTSSLLAKIIAEYFDPEYVMVVEGDAHRAELLLEQKFNYIFFTGSPKVGSLVMQAAAKQLTPVTLELGGKNPCIVNADCDLDAAAKRIVAGKFTNVGQSCVAPDYLFVHHSIKRQFIENLKKYIVLFYGQDPAANHDYPNIVTPEHVDRLAGLIQGANVLMGGTYDRQKRYFAPTLIELGELFAQHPSMQGEIFGPILPIIEYETIDYALGYITSKPKPLAFYLFTNDKKLQNTIINQTSSGGVCINNISLQAANLNLPFGGVGRSGIGHYHGKYSFLTFSHAKPIVKGSNWFDKPLYKSRSPLLKKFLDWVVR